MMVTLPPVEGPGNAEKGVRAVAGRSTTAAAALRAPLPQPQAEANRKHQLRHTLALDSNFGPDDLSCTPEGDDAPRVGFPKDWSCPPAPLRKSLVLEATTESVDSSQGSDEENRRGGGGVNYCPPATMVLVEGNPLGTIQLLCNSDPSVHQSLKGTRGENGDYCLPDECSPVEGARPETVSKQARVRTRRTISGVSVQKAVGEDIDNDCRPTVQKSAKLGIINLGRAQRNVLDSGLLNSATLASPTGGMVTPLNVAGDASMMMDGFATPVPVAQAISMNQAPTIPRRSQGWVPRGEVLQEAGVSEDDADAATKQRCPGLRKTVSATLDTAAKGKETAAKVGSKETAGQSRAKETKTAGRDLSKTVSRDLSKTVSRDLCKTVSSDPFKKGESGAAKSESENSQEPTTTTKSFPGAGEPLVEAQEEEFLVTEELPPGSDGDAEGGYYGEERESRERFLVTAAHGAAQSRGGGNRRPGSSAKARSSSTRQASLKRQTANERPAVSPEAAVFDYGEPPAETGTGTGGLGPRTRRARRCSDGEVAVADGRLAKSLSAAELAADAMEKSKAARDEALRAKSRRVAKKPITTTGDGELEEGASVAPPAAGAKGARRNRGEGSSSLVGLKSHEKTARRRYWVNEEDDDSAAEPVGGAGRLENGEMSGGVAKTVASDHPDLELDDLYYSRFSSLENSSESPRRREETMITASSPQPPFSSLTGSSSRQVESSLSRRMMQQQQCPSLQRAGSLPFRRISSGSSPAVGSSRLRQDCRQLSESLTSSPPLRAARKLPSPPVGGQVNAFRRQVEMLSQRQAIKETDNGGQRYRKSSDLSPNSQPFGTADCSDDDGAAPERRGQPGGGDMNAANKRPNQSPTRVSEDDPRGFVVVAKNGRLSFGKGEAGGECLPPPPPPPALPSGDALTTAGDSSFEKQMGPETRAAAGAEDSGVWDDGSTNLQPCRRRTSLIPSLEGMLMMEDESLTKKNFAERLILRAVGEVQAQHPKFGPKKLGAAIPSTTSTQFAETPRPSYRPILRRGISPALIGLVSAFVAALALVFAPLSARKAESQSAWFTAIQFCDSGAFDAEREVVVDSDNPSLSVASCVACPRWASCAGGVFEGCRLPYVLAEEFGGEEVYKGPERGGNANLAKIIRVFERRAVSPLFLHARKKPGGLLQSETASAADFGKTCVLSQRVERATAVGLAASLKFLQKRTGELECMPTHPVKDSAVDEAAGGVDASEVVEYAREALEADRRRSQLTRAELMFVIERLGFKFGDPAFLRDSGIKKVNLENHRSAAFSGAGRSSQSPARLVSLDPVYPLGCAMRRFVSPRVLPTFACAVGVLVVVACMRRRNRKRQILQVISAIIEENTRLDFGSKIILGPTASGVFDILLLTVQHASGPETKSDSGYDHRPSLHHDENDDSADFRSRSHWHLLSQSLRLSARDLVDLFSGASLAQVRFWCEELACVSPEDDGKTSSQAKEADIVRTYLRNVPASEGPLFFSKRRIMRDNFGI